MTDETAEVSTHDDATEVSPSVKEDITLVSVDLPNDVSGREGNPRLNLVRSDGQIKLVISNLDPTNFEAVVGPKSAERYRGYVSARRSSSVDASRSGRSRGSRYSRGA
jgi:hypothetical protein